MVCFVSLRWSSVRFGAAFAFGCLEVPRTHFSVGLVESIAGDTTNRPNRNCAQLGELLVRRQKRGGMPQATKKPDAIPCPIPQVARAPEQTVLRVRPPAVIFASIASMRRDLVSKRRSHTLWSDYE